MEIACPRCNQDWVQKVKVKKTGREIFICPECEAIWFCRDSIEYATFNYFSYYMERQELRDDWAELDVLEAYNGRSNPD